MTASFTPLDWAALIAATVFIPLYRQSSEVSAYAHLERRFGTWARLYAGGFYLLTQVARMGTVMYLMALPLHVLLGIEIRTLILFTGLAVTVYSFIGGVTAVIWTDALQACVLMGGTVVCLGVLAAGLPAGAPQAVSTAFAEGRFSLGSLDPLDLSAATVWVVLLYGITLNLQNFGIDQSYVQRYIAARSDAEARKAVWLGRLLGLPGPLAR
jgi:solute:Na+ symporter, SSS family